MASSGFCTNLERGIMASLMPVCSVFELGGVVLVISRSMGLDLKKVRGLRLYYK